MDATGTLDRWRSPRDNRRMPELSGDPGEFWRVTAQPDLLVRIGQYVDELARSNPPAVLHAMTAQLDRYAHNPTRIAGPATIRRT